MLLGVSKRHEGGRGRRIYILKDKTRKGGLLRDVPAQLLRKLNVDGKCFGDSWERGEADPAGIASILPE